MIIDQPLSYTHVGPTFAIKLVSQRPTQRCEHVISPHSTVKSLTQEHSSTTNNKLSTKDVARQQAAD